MALNKPLPVPGPDGEQAGPASDYPIAEQFVTNPYESPSTEAASTQSSALIFRLLAGVLWLIGLVPSTLLVVGAVRQGLPDHLDLRDPAIWLGMSLAIMVIGVLPLIGFALLGWASWRRSWRLAGAGTIVIVTCGLLITFFVLFAPKPEI